MNMLLGWLVPLGIGIGWWCGYMTGRIFSWIQFEKGEGIFKAKGELDRLVNKAD